MQWQDLNLWCDEEEQRIITCIEQALERLIASGVVDNEHEEKVISGKLRVFLRQVKKELELIWTIQPEAPTFDTPDAPDPFGRPDIRFTANTPDFDQYDYDIECKLVRVKRYAKTHNYCKYYVEYGMQRFQQRVYAQSKPPMGMMIGYVQEGNIPDLLDTINIIAKSKGFHTIKSKSSIREKGVSRLNQALQRTLEQFILQHIWADLR